MKTDPNDSAYPQDTCEDWQPSFAGLTKREAFAAMAMQGLLSQYDRPWLDDLGKPLRPSKIHNRISSTSVAYADALISALNEEAK